MKTTDTNFHHSEDSPERASSEFSQNSLSRDLLTEWNNFLKSTPRTAKEQIIGKDVEMEMTEGEEISLTKKEEMTVETSPNHARYVSREVEVNVESTKKEERLRQEQVKDIQTEIKTLIDASKEMEMAFKNISNEVSVDNLPENTGIYHVGFFEWVLTTIRQARSRIEKGSSWLNTFSNKKSQQGYWQSVKKSGFNNVHMSSERSSVTQTG